MKRNYNFSHRLISCILFISLFLQSCGSSFNQLVPQEKEQKEQADNIPTLREQIDNNSLEGRVGKREFKTSGGDLVTFYKQDGRLQAAVRVDKSQREPNYKNLPVVIEPGTEVLELLRLDSKTQQGRIQIQIPQNGQPGRVVVSKGGLPGGMKRNITNKCGEEKEKEKEKDPAKVEGESCKEDEKELVQDQEELQNEQQLSVLLELEDILCEVPEKHRYEKIKEFLESLPEEVKKQLLPLLAKKLRKPKTLDELPDELKLAILVYLNHDPSFADGEKGQEEAANSLKSLLCMSQTSRSWRNLIFGTRDLGVGLRRPMMVALLRKFNEMQGPVNVGAIVTLHRVFVRLCGYKKMMAPYHNSFTAFLPLYACHPELEVFLQDGVEEFYKVMLAKISKASGKEYQGLLQELSLSPLLPVLLKSSLSNQIIKVFINDNTSDESPHMLIRLARCISSDLLEDVLNLKKKGPLYSWFMDSSINDTRLAAILVGLLQNNDIPFSEVKGLVTKFLQEKADTIGRTYNLKILLALCRRSDLDQEGFDFCMEWGKKHCDFSTHPFVDKYVVPVVGLAARFLGGGDHRCLLLSSAGAVFCLLASNESLSQEQLIQVWDTVMSRSRLPMSYYNYFFLCLMENPNIPKLILERISIAESERDLRTSMFQKIFELDIDYEWKRLGKWDNIDRDTGWF